MFDLAFASAPELVRALGQRLREQRLAKPVTQDELAVRAGISVGAVKKLEATGLTTMETFVRVVQALGLVDELVDFMVLRPTTSIAAMEKAEAAKRRRVRHPVARRRP
jgi:transcriptional regulator with XRE-family HTH domain